MANDRKLPELEQLHLQFKQFAMDNSSDEILWVDSEARIHYANKTACDALGYTQEELLRLSIPDFDPLFPIERWNEHWKSLKRDKVQKFEALHKRKDGSLYPVEVVANYVNYGGLEYNVGYARDITERKQAEARLEHLANYDVLTDLPNRLLFFDRLKQALSIAKRESTRVALLVVDLDGFKDINDNLGHQMGDLLLKEVARRLGNSIRESDTVARFGGDEFVVLLPNISSDYDGAANQAKVVAEKMRLALQHPISIGGHPVSVSCSIGIALYPEHGSDDNDLLKAADIAMYCSKNNARNLSIICVRNEKKSSAARQAIRSMGCSCNGQWLNCPKLFS